ncbi:hypothetical protein Y032_0261g555 [Ancylostoma ceylanicum]|uniref:Uncharacterized protein n=1 Tax=Ancylostoma ceylanicum TaxID=53326 RepID=A0A016SAZ5_9BILA|nr:hypothetical protein Y032_0261g555 [Ancylostoma ceylanicum]
MRSSHVVVLLVTLAALASAFKAKKQKKEEVFVQVPPDVPGGEPRYVKAPKVLTEYDKCKMECKKQRDAANRKEHITALREQLAALEAEEAAAASSAGEATNSEQVGFCFPLKNRENSCYRNRK